MGGQSPAVNQQVNKSGVYPQKIYTIFSRFGGGSRPPCPPLSPPLWNTKVVQDNKDLLQQLLKIFEGPWTTLYLGPCFGAPQKNRCACAFLWGHGLMPFRPLFPCVPWSSDISKSKNAGKQGTKRHKSSGGIQFNANHVQQIVANKTLLQQKWKLENQTETKHIAKHFLERRRTIKLWR